MRDRTWRRRLRRVLRRAAVAQLGQLVCGEQRQGFVAATCYLLAQCGLASRVAGDLVIVADGKHKSGDPGPKSLAQLRRTHVSLFDQVVHDASCD